MIRIGWRMFMRRITLVVILLSLLLLQPGVAARPPRDDTPGAYRLIFRGCYTGTGNGVVTPKKVTIHGDVVDESGNHISFDASDLTLENHRFHNQVSVGGTTIIITGRVDPSGGTLRKARINCTFTAVGIGFGRVAGDHN
jgi:hypothetical protein